MKKNYIADIRYSEKIKQSQSFKSIDGLQKKVRKKFKILQNMEYDAQKQLRQIMCFWKQGWDYQHFHPIFLNPKVFYPIVTMADPSQQTHPELKKYAQLIQKIIFRLKIDQEIEVNYKIQQRNYISNWENINFTHQNWKYFKVATLSNKHLLKCLDKTTKAMLQSAEESIRVVETLTEHFDGEHLYRIEQIHKQLRFLQKIINRNYPEQQQTEMQDQSKQNIPFQLEQLDKFVANVTIILEEMKDEKYGPSLISVQPKIGELTYVLHPIIWSLYSFFYKEQVKIKHVNRLEKQLEEIIQNTQKEITPKQFQEFDQMKKLKIAQHWNQLPQRPQQFLIPIKDNFKRQNQAYSRVVFVNLDGYESQYNLEVAKNFYKNMIYVSFPKFQTNSQKKPSSYEQRFYNKMMFETTRISQQMESENQELDFMYKQQKILKSPELYHQHIEKLYHQNNPQPEVQFQHQNQQDQRMIYEEDYMKIIDRNERIYIFPIKMSCLLEKNREQFPETSFITKDRGFRMEAQHMEEDASHEAQKLCDMVENYESYLIQFLMRKYLYGQIQKFRPTHIIISYSNRIVIEDSHFVEMIQELTNLAKCKIMFFPNFTTSFVDQIKIETVENASDQEEDLLNCYTVSNARLQFTTPNPYIDSMSAKGFDNCPMTLSFLAKVMRFLKISSGTYNLQQKFEYETFAIKLKTVKIYPYTQFLFNVLSQEYSNLANKIDKEMLKADKYFLEERIREEKDDLKRCIPKLYMDLFQMLKTLIIEGIYEGMNIQQSSEKQSQAQGQPLSPYTIDVRRIFEAWTKISDRAGIKRVRLYNMQRIKQPFEEFINSEEKQKMDAKFETNYHMYFKIRTQYSEYSRSTEASINLKSSQVGMRLVTFMYTKANDSSLPQKEAIKNTKQDKAILPIYKDTSILFQTNQINHSDAIVLVMNHLGLNDQHVNHYIGQVKLDQSKSTFSREECLVKPIIFYDGNQIIQQQKFKAKCEWNFKQTQHYLILYWPSEYDFVKAALFKMIKQQYEPRICHDIFIAKKCTYTHFYKATINLDISAASILPRRGCSTYNYKNKLFIFGGVYEREYNYMNVQNDIVTMDLDELYSKKNYQKEQMCEKECEQKMGQLAISETQIVMNVNLSTCALTLKNLKGQLYSKEYVNEVVNDGGCKRRLNSFVRPKLQVEFFEINDIAQANLHSYFANQEHHTVIMMGGYGENFMFPHSLLTYFYHVLKFDKVERELRSIQKKNIEKKPVPINLKELVKNKNIFQHFNIYENETVSKGLTKQSHFIFHRVVYQLSMEGSKDKKYENQDPKHNFKKRPEIKHQTQQQAPNLDINYKFILLYATQLYNDMDKNYIRFAEKIGQKRLIEQSQGIRVEVVSGCNNNLFISNEDGTFLYCLNFKESVFSTQTLPLINEAIISLDVTNNIVCAIIKHKQHTRDKCVLASDKIQMPDPKYAFQNSNHYVNLIKFIEFNDNYELHTLFMMKRTELIIAHGVSFQEYQVNDKVITTKYINAEGLGQIRQELSPEIPTPTVSLKQFYDCTSFLAREKQRIFSMNFMSSQSKQEDFVYAFAKYSLDMNTSKKEWKMEGNEIRYVSFYMMNGESEVYLRKVQFVELRQSSRSKVGDSQCLIVPLSPVSLSQHKFCFSLERIQSDKSFSYNNKQVLKVRVYDVSENEPWSRVSWRRIYKNQQRYEDCGIKQRQQIEGMEKA